MAQDTPTAEDILRIKKKIAKGYRLVACPNCGKKTWGKFLEEVIACGKCGYKKLSTEEKS